MEALTKMTKNETKLGWLDLNGNFFEVEFGNHYCWAAEYLKKEGVLLDNVDYDDELIRRGWVKIIDYLSRNKNGFTIQNYIFNWFNDRKRITKAQENWLFDNHPRLLEEYYIWAEGGFK